MATTPSSGEAENREAAYALDADEVLRRWGTDPDQGLDEARVHQQRQRYGPNQLSEAPPPPWWQRLLRQFRDLVIWILIVAAVVSMTLGEWIDALAILAIVVLNGVIGFFQEERAEQALASLKAMSAPMAKALRGGRLVQVSARELVPGDLIQIEAGDNIPADARLVRGFRLSMQEAALTGESTPVEKNADTTLPPQTPLADRRNTIYMGTITAAGKGTALVVATGMQTELGRIAGLLERHEVEPTPLERRLAELGRVLIVICLVLVGVVFALQVFRQGNLAEAFLLAVSLAVAAVPEGLPAVVTISLALGLTRMVKRNALVRRLPSVETLGSVSVICSDKTGTLTRNEMTVRELVAGDVHYRVTGTGYAPQGQFFPFDQVPRDAAGDDAAEANAQAVDVQSAPDLLQALSIGAWCNNSRVVPRGKGEPGWEVIGDPTEAALVVAALKAGIEANDRERAVLFEIPFDSTRKAMSVVVRKSDGQAVLYTKGAPEVILGKCTSRLRAGRIEPLSDQDRQEIHEANAEMARRALRVLALAYRVDVLDRPDPDQVERQLVFAGLAGMIDPPRDEARRAVALCRQAGIRPVMITGDHPATALAVARELKLAEAEQRGVTGEDLDALPDEELQRDVEQIAVYARTTAEHKLRIVRAWKRRGQVVAMTGDGVNDAPAVKEADIGIAMGITGTDVTKEASDMVLMDDNFASIVSAVEEGRGIFDNIRKVLQYLLSCNAGEILLMLAAGLLGWRAPLLPIQLLWINLVTDGLPALALSLEPPEPGVMRRRPRRPDESILSPELGLAIVLQGIVVGGTALAAFALSDVLHPGDPDRAQALTFCVLVYSELLRGLAARSTRYTLPELGFFTNPMLLLAVVVSGLLQASMTVFPFTRHVFGTEDLAAAEWMIIGLLALVPITVIEVTKLVRSWLRRPGEA